MVELGIVLAWSIDNVLGVRDRLGVLHEGSPRYQGVSGLQQGQAGDQMTTEKKIIVHLGGLWQGACGADIKKGYLAGQKFDGVFSGSLLNTAIDQEQTVRFVKCTKCLKIVKGEKKP